MTIEAQRGTHQWRRAFRDQKCGKSGCAIKKGDPVLEIRLHGGTMVRVRCQACAKKTWEETPPADLPPLREPVQVKPMLHIAMGVGTLPLDYKAAAAGRQPGEDD